MNAYIYKIAQRDEYLPYAVQAFTWHICTNCYWFHPKIDYNFNYKKLLTSLKKMCYKVHYKKVLTSLKNGLQNSLQNVTDIKSVLQIKSYWLFKKYFTNFITKITDLIKNLSQISLWKVTDFIIKWVTNFMTKGYWLCYKKKLQIPLQKQITYFITKCCWLH